ncbi:MAG: hypothetical protein ABL973_00335 [Micropepsaceae bacterium]
MPINRALKIAAHAALLFAALTASASATDLTGKWRVTWAQNVNNTNNLDLTQSENRITGTYVNDAKENCRITGTIDEAGTQLALQVACKTWGIRMEGTVSVDRTTVSGNYAAYLDDKGTFVMKRR